MVTVAQMWVRVIMSSIKFEVRQQPQGNEYSITDAGSDAELMPDF